MSMLFRRRPISQFLQIALPHVLRGFLDRSRTATAPLFPRHRRLRLAYHRLPRARDLAVLRDAQPHHVPEMVQDVLLAGVLLNRLPGNLQPDWQYVWSPRYVDAAVLRDKNTDADGLCDDERLYYLCDANFNVTTLVDTNGDAVERYLYDAYGTVTIYDGSWTNTRSTSSYANVVMES